MAHPLVPEDFIALVAPLAATDQLRGRLVARHLETAEAATITVRPGRGWRPHVPGQYVRLGIDIDGVRHWRAYSVTSPLDQHGTFTITVKAIPEGRVSHHLVHHAPLGTLVVLDQATGDFVLPDPPPQRVLFLTAGSGITPVMGMLRNHALGDVVLVHSAPDADAAIFGPELRQRAADGELTFIERHTDADGQLPLGELAAVVPDWRERHTFACGPAGLLADAEAYWDEAGLADRLHVERFRRASVEPGEGGTVTFATSGVTVDADGATPLLDVGEEQGVLMPSGCRMGICFGCVSPLLDGSVRDLRNGQITVAEDNDTILVQTCVSAAAGACTIDR